MTDGPCHLKHHLKHHRKDDRGLIADKNCGACKPLFFIFGSQIVDEPIAAFEARVMASRRAHEERRAQRINDRLGPGV